jgi:hypothetical protein
MLRGGDVIVLVAGGHGMTAMEDVELTEVMQGPYLRDGHKTYIGKTGDVAGTGG